MEAGVNDIAGHGYEIADESGNGDVLLLETAVSLGATSYQLPRIQTEESQLIDARSSGAGSSSEDSGMLWRGMGS